MQSIKSIRNLDTNTNIAKNINLNIDENIIKSNITIFNLDMQVILTIIFIIF